VCHADTTRRQAGESSLLEQSLRDLAAVREGLQEESDAFRHVIVSAANGLRDILAVAAGREVRDFHLANVPSVHRTLTSPPSGSASDARDPVLLTSLRAKSFRPFV
jgi:hypothetical protein